MEYGLEKQPKRYTIGQFCALNRGTVKHPEALATKFASYPMPACALETPYNNPYNVPFREACKGMDLKKPLLKKSASVYEDAHILSSLRRAFSSVSTSKDQVVLAIAEINQILIPDTMIVQVSELFFDVMIQCSTQIQEYLKVLFSLSYKDGLEQKIYLNFVKHVMKMYETPLLLEDSKLEAGASRTKRHREATCELLAHLFAFDFASLGRPEALAKPRAFFGKEENMRTRLIDPLFVGISKGDANEVANLVRVLSIIIPSGKFNTSYYEPKIREVLANKDKKFKLMEILLLRDFVKA